MSGSPQAVLDTLKFLALALSVLCGTWALSVVTSPIAETSRPMPKPTLYRRPINPTSLDARLTTIPAEGLTDRHAGSDHRAGHDSGLKRRTEGGFCTGMQPFHGTSGTN